MKSSRENRHKRATGRNTTGNGRGDSGGKGDNGNNGGEGGEEGTGDAGIFAVSSAINASK